MRILTAFPKEQIIQFNRVNNIFSDLSDFDAADSVVLVIEGEDFSLNLSTAIGLSIPVIVIAGLKGTGQKYMQEAQDCGVPDRCIIFKDNENIIAADGYKFGQSSMGINIKTMSEIASYVLENRLFPDIYVWREPETKQGPVQNGPQVWQEPNQQATRQTKPNTQKSRPIHEQARTEKIKKRIVTEDLLTFLSKTKVLGVLKSVPTINSATIAKMLAERLNGIHLEVNNNPNSYQQYDSGKENAMQNLYAFTNGKTVDYGAFEFEWIVVEINPLMLDVMGVVYEQASQIIYVVESLDESESALDMWIEGGYKLDAIISDPINLTPYKYKYGDKVMELDHFVNQIERG